MIVLQVVVNVLVSLLAIALNHWLFMYVSNEPALVLFLIDVLLVVVVFAANVAARLKVK